MTLDELLARLFPAGHAVERGPHGTISGSAELAEGKRAAVIGIVDGTPLGVDGALTLAASVLAAIEQADGSPLLVLVDTSSQNMSRRDELLGLNEYLAHLSKCLALAAKEGHRTVSILYGHAAAGAFIATALSSQVLVALPSADPSVMDLPSIARVTKLPLDQLKELAKATPIFAPGLEPLFATGAVAEIWNPETSLADALRTLLARDQEIDDRRGEMGFARKGRLWAARVAQLVGAEAASGS
jgi:malonate decarboxylase gamma subunit